MASSSAMAIVPSGKTVFHPDTSEKTPAMLAGRMVYANGVLSFSETIRADSFQQFHEWLSALGKERFVFESLRKKGATKPGGGAKNGLGRFPDLKTRASRQVLDPLQLVRAVLQFDTSDYEVQIGASVSFSFQWRGDGFERRGEFVLQRTAARQFLYTVRFNLGVWGTHGFGYPSDQSSEVENLRQILAHRLLQIEPPETLRREDDSYHQVTPVRIPASHRGTNGTVKILAPRSPVLKRDRGPISYQALQLQAREERVPLSKIIERIQGEEADWPTSIRQWRERKGMNAASLGEAMARALGREAAIDHRTVSYLENWTPETPNLPARALVMAHAAVRGSDPSLDFYRLNRMRYPSLPPRWTEGDGFEIYSDSTPIDHFFTGLGARPFDPTNMGHRVLVHVANPFREPALPYAAPRDQLSWRSVADFLVGKEMTSPAHVERFANQVGLPLDDIQKYITDLLCPDLSRMLAKVDLGGRAFLFDANRDPDAVRFYADRTDKLGFFLWAHRRVRGWTQRDVGIKAGFSHQLYGKLERDDAEGLVTPRVIQRLADVFATPLSVINDKADQTYAVRVSGDRSGNMTPGTFRSVVQRGVRGQNVDKLLEQASGKLLRFGLKTDLSKNEILNVTQNDPSRSRVTDEALARFYLSFHETMDGGLYWAKARPDRETVFPQLSWAQPRFVFHELRSPAQLLGLSLAEVVTRQRLEEGVTKLEMARRLGLCATAYVDFYEGIETYPDPVVSNFVTLGKGLNIDVAPYFLSASPWMLLGLPVVDGEGKSVPGYVPHGRKPTAEELRALTQVIGTQLADRVDGRRVIRDYLESEKIGRDADALIAKGISSPVAWRMVRERTVLTDEELIEIREKLPTIDGEKLYRGFRFGEWKVMMEGNWNMPDGWTVSDIENLDLVDVTVKIWEQGRKQGEEYGAFWYRREGFKVEGLPSWKRLIQKGLRCEQMVKLARMARTAGLEKITPKILYLYFRGPRLARFVPLHDATGNFGHYDHNLPSYRRVENLRAIRMKHQRPVAL